MLKDLKIGLDNHFRDNLLMYVLGVFLLVVGVVLGTLAVNLLTLEEIVELTQYLSAFMGAIDEIELGYFLVFKESVVGNLKTLGFIWFLGLTVLGVPLILVLLLSRGFMLGFTAGFLIQEQGLHGIILSLIALVLPNILILPTLLLASVMGIGFSIWLVKGRHRTPHLGFGRQFISYSIYMLIFAFIIICGSLLDAYASIYLSKFIGLFFDS